MKYILFVTLIMTASAFSVANAQDNGGHADSGLSGTVAYSLPSTTLLLDVEAACEKFYAGPYAKFASKYLGIDVRQKDAVTYTLSKVRMSSRTEADLSARYLLDLAGGMYGPLFLELTGSGLVSSSMKTARSGEWRFPVMEDAGFETASYPSNLTMEATTLYKGVKDGAGFDKVAVKQDMLVRKTEEMRAAEIAGLIFSLREQRLSIITGDTDASYEGDAMRAALEEIDRLEKEYMVLFTGYSEWGSQSMTFEIVPEKGRSMYIAFRISDSAGLLPPDNLSGKPVVLEMTGGDIAAPQPPDRKVKKSGVPVIHYRIPAVCSVKLTDGADVLMQGRIPVYQFGEESTMPADIRLNQ